jgi:hypothetical protein
MCGQDRGEHSEKADLRYGHFFLPAVENDDSSICLTDDEQCDISVSSAVESRSNCSPCHSHTTTCGSDIFEGEDDAEFLDLDELFIHGFSDGDDDDAAAAANNLTLGQQDGFVDEDDIPAADLDGHATPTPDHDFGESLLTEPDDLFFNALDDLLDW